MESNVRDAVDYAIVTAANDGYHSLLMGLLDSLWAAEVKAPVHVLDLGLTALQRDALHARGVVTTEPGWDIDIRRKTVLDRHGHRIPLPSHFRAFTAQPFLPRYVTGHDIILWIDADCWVQDASAIDMYLSVAREDKLAIALEVDRSYSAPYWRLKSHLRDFIGAFGFKEGLVLARKMTANAGVFALRTTAPHWKIWQRATARSMRRTHERSQQMALNHMIYISKMPCAFLPATCNWQSWEATALYDEARGKLVEPNPPYQVIGIMHNAQADKNQVFPVTTRTGASRPGTMRYEQWAKA